MEFLVIGSGCGVVNYKRKAPCSLLKTSKYLILFDIGPGALWNIEKFGFDTKEIDFIFISHLHTDHVHDLAAFLFSFKYPACPRKKELFIIGPSISPYLQGLFDLYKEQLESDSYRLNPIDIKPNSAFKLKEINIQAFSMRHVVETIGYRLEVEGKIIAYGADTEISDNLLSLIDNSDLSIIECSFPFKVEGHTCIEDFDKIIKKNYKKLIVTHIYPIMQGQELIKLVKKDKRIIIAEDSLRIQL